MAFRLRPDERVGAGLARIVKEEVRKAISGLDRRPLGDEVIFETRKHVKKIRAAVRLLEPADGRRLRRADKRLRRISRMLSPLRDAPAMAEF